MKYRQNKYLTITIYRSRYTHIWRCCYSNSLHTPFVHQTTLNDAFSPINGGRTNARRIVVLITDGGVSSAEFGDPMNSADSLRNDGINTFVVSHNHFFVVSNNLLDN